MGVKGSKLSRFKKVRGVIPRGSPHQVMTPRGYIPVLVCDERSSSSSKRFMVHRAAFCDDADFLELLRRSAEEYGFSNEGILKIPYKANDFEERIMSKGHEQKKTNKFNLMVR